MRALVGQPTRQAVAVLLVVMFASSIPVPASAANPPTLPRLEFVDAQLDPLGATDAATGDGAAVFVQLTRPVDPAASRSFSSVRGVAIRSTHADGSAFDAGWTIDLLETNPGSGIFVGSFRVSPPAAQSAATPRSPAPPSLAHPEFGKIFGDGVLRIESGGQLVAQLGTLQAQTLWQPASDAIVSGPAPGTEIRGYGTRLDFRVQDKDLNIDSRATERYSTILRAYSDSAPNGVFVPLVESDANAQTPLAALNSAVFKGSVTLTDNPSVGADAGLLFVRPNERIWAVYQDRADAQGRAARIEVPAIGQQPWMFQPTTSGVLSIGPAHHFLQDRVDASGSSDGIYEEPIVLTIADHEPSVGSEAAATLPVTLRISDPSQDPVTVDLATLGNGIGLFQASLTILKPEDEGGPAAATMPEPSPGLSWVRVGNGARIEASYEDIDASGVRVTRTATTRIHQLSDAVLQLGPSTTTGLLVGSRASHALILRDADANLDPAMADRVDVQVRSRTDTTGIRVELIEDSDNTGTFIGAISFGPEASSHGRLSVRDGDAVVAEYWDGNRLDRNDPLVRSNIITWHAGGQASIQFDAPVYARQAPPTACDWNATARVIVQDVDADDPVQIDVLELTFREAGGSPQTVEATETGVHTAVFVAQIPFGRATAPCPPSPTRFQPSLAPGIDPVERKGNVRTLEAAYFDINGANGAPNEAVAQATWIEGGGLARFETDWDAGATGLNVLYHDVAADAEPFPLTPQTPGTKTFLAVYSSQVPSGIYASSERCPDTLRPLDFVERPLNSGRWMANITVTTDTASTGSACVPAAFQDAGARLRIKDVVGRTVADNIRLIGIPPSVAAPVLSVRGVTGSTLRVLGAGVENVGAVQLAIGDHKGIGIEFIAPTLNKDHTRLDTTSVSGSAFSPSTGNTATFQLIETAADSDTFVGTLSLRDGAGAGGRFVTATDSEAVDPTALRDSPHRKICFWDSGNGAGITNNPDAYANNDTFEPIYLKLGSTCGPVAPGDVRLTGSGGILTLTTVPGAQPSSESAAGYDLYPGGAIVRASDLDVGKPTIETWSDHYNGTGRVVPNPTGSRFAYTDLDADQTWDALEPVYVDLDGSNSVSVNDVRISDNIPDGRNGFLPAFSRVAVGQKDCVGLGTAARTCGPSTALRALPTTRLGYVDVDHNAAFDDHDALYLDRSAGTGLDRMTGVADLRLTGLGDVSGKVLSVNVADIPRVPGLGLASRATVPTSVLVASDRQPSVTASIRWVPGQLATVVGVPGYGTEIRPQLLIRDDVAGEYRDDVRITSTGTTVFAPSERARPDTLLLYATATERVPQDQVGTAPSPDSYVVRAQGRGAKGIADRDGDGRLSCSDLDISAGATCTSTPLDLLNGIVRYRCVSNTCAFQLNYMYQVATISELNDPCTVCDVYHATVGPDGKITFGAAVPDGQRLRLDYRPASIRLSVSSLETSSSIDAPFHLVIDPFGSLSYVGDIPVAPEGGAGLQVRAGPGARDELRVQYADRRTPADVVRAADPAGLITALGTTSWIASDVGQILFGPGGSIDDVAGSVNGPLVPIQIRDADADLSDRPDALTVTVRNLNDARDATTVLARETGARTGIFQATVPVATTACAPTCPRPDGAIHMPNGEGMLVVSYADPHGRNGNPATVTAAVRWRTADTADVVVGGAPLRLGASGALIPGPTSLVVRGSDAALYIAVADSDRNSNSFAVETITVRVTTADDPVGEVIRLVETGLASGTFLSPGVRFETLLIANNGRVFARDPAATGEKVRVIYEDPLNEDGLHQYIEPSTLIRWKRTFDGVTSFDQPTYVGTKTDGASGTIRFGSVLVQDGDLNLDSTIIDRPTVKVAVGRPGSDGRLDPTRTVQLRLFETRANSGVFLARFSFSTANTDAPVAEGDITSASGQIALVPMAAVGSGGRLRAEYLDAEDSRGAPLGANVTYAASAQWFAAGVGVLRFDQPGYNDFADVPELTLIDRDLDVSAQPDTVAIKLRSNIESAGLMVTLVEDGNRTGVFRSTIGLDAEGSPPGKIHVRETDTLIASYQDSFPLSTRTTSARIGIGEHSSAATNLRTTPPLPTGLRGAFLEPITVNLSANKAIEAIFYRLGASGANQTYTGPIALGEGVHQLAFWSIDVFGNVETVREQTIVVDVTSPTEPIGALVAKATRGGTATLSWDPVPGTGDPLSFYDYVVFRDEDLARAIGNTSSAGFLDETLEGDGAHVYRVLARDLAGRAGPLSAPVSVTVDALPPSVTQLQARPVSFDLRAPPSILEATATVTEARLESVNLTLLRGDGTELEAAPMNRVVGTSFRGLIEVQNITEPCLCILRVEAMDAAGNNGTAERRLLIDGPDDVVPQVRWPTSVDPEVPRGTPIEVIVSDNVMLASVLYLIDGQRETNVAVPHEHDRLAFKVQTGSLSVGNHTLTVVAVDAARDDAFRPRPNTFTQHLSFSVIAPGSVLDMTEGSGFVLPTDARRRADGLVQVNWLVAPQEPVPWLGFQVWRSSSPYRLLANVTDAEARHYVDATASPGKTYRYLVTGFTAESGLFETLDQVPGYSEFAGSQLQATVSDDDDDWPAWLWVVLGSAALFVIGAIAAIALSGRSASNTIAKPAPVAAMPRTGRPTVRARPVGVPRAVPAQATVAKRPARTAPAPIVAHEPGPEPGYGSIMEESVSHANVGSASNIEPPNPGYVVVDPFDAATVDDDQQSASLASSNAATQEDGEEPSYVPALTLQCPRCGTTFGTDDEPPVKVKCPGCGKKGKVK